MINFELGLEFGFNTYSFIILGIALFVYIFPKLTEFLTIAGAGFIVGGSLETSNVQIVHEMVDLIATQKAFDTNSKVISVSDKMMDTANNLTR